MTRGFDVETDRINLASFFGDPLAFDAAYDEARRAPRGEYWAWTDVDVGRDGLLDFVRAEKAKQLRRLEHANIEEFLNRLQDFEKRAGKQPSQRDAERIARENDLYLKQAVIREITQKHFPNSRGRPRLARIS